MFLLAAVFVAGPALGRHVVLANVRIFQGWLIG